MAAPTFLTGIRKITAPALVNTRTDRPVASVIEIAGTSETRRRGLLGRDSLDPSHALIIAPCSSIHTFFMRFSIDLLFVDRAGRVLKIVRGLRPWRIAGSLRAYAVIEMASGSVQDVSAGDQLRMIGSDGRT